jgi:hypothetical protein
VSFDVKLYQLACERYQSLWGLTDEILYRLCRDHPDHASRRAVNAKLWLIGRTYATGLERKAKKTGGQGSALEAVAEHVFKHASQVDTIIAGLQDIREPLDPHKLSRIVAAHGQFTTLLTEALREGQTPRSFAAKYLHFHCPAVPIYDSWAWAALGRRRWDKHSAIFDLPAGAEDVYYSFALRFWYLYCEAQQTGLEVSVRLLDRYLVEETDGGKKGTE